MTSERTSGDSSRESGSHPLDIDDVHILLQATKKKLPNSVGVERPSERSRKETHNSRVEQEQIQKRTFTNWINAQLSKRRPPVTVLDLFNDLRDGSRLLDLLEVISDQRMSREKGRGTFQHRTNIEKALEFLKRKSIKLVNINVSDIMDGKPSIILGLVWTIIMHFHIEELASTLSFSSRQPSLESLASLDSRSTSSSARSSPVPPHGSPLHARFRVSAKKALLLWVREQCHRAGCTLNVKDFKGSWRSGVVFLAILSALRPNSVNLTRARTRTNRQNLEEAFLIAERELHIPRLLDPADVDVREPDEKSIMTYVAQFLQYSKDTPSSDEEMCHSPQQRLSPVNLPSDFTPSIGASPIRQTSANQKAQEVTCWLVHAYEELIEGWDSTEGESYAERYHVFHTFIVSFNEQRRPVMPLLTAMKRTPQLSAEQKALRRAWDTLAEKLREYKTELDLSLPSPLDSVGRWLLRIEEVLSAEGDDSLDHARAAEEAREKLELLKVCLEEMPHHIKRFNMFQNTDEFGETLVPRDKMDEMKRRFTSVRVTAKYHSIKIEYQERRHAVLDLLNRLKIKLRSWKRAYFSLESVRVLMQDWNETVNNQELASMLDGAFHRLKHIASKYTSKAALAEDSTQVNSQVAELERDVAATLEGVRMVKGTMARVLGAWDTYSDTLTSLHAWLEQGPHRQRHGQRTEVTSSMMSEWNSRQSHLNEVGNYLIEVTDPLTSRGISDELCKINLLCADFAKRAQFTSDEEPNIGPSSPQTVQSLIREANQLLKEPVEVVSAPLRTYTKRLQFVMKKIKDVDLEALSPSLDCSHETLSKLQQAIPEVLQTLCEAEQVCDELRLSVSGLDSRLAELLHWETEARELHQVLKEETHTRKRGQDPRVRLLISKGLQLEGQVVMEDQDLQVMVMTSQKTSPLQYLIASHMQDRVRGAVEKSQEAVGMLSSLGACRDRSPARDQPPAKIFVQPQEAPQSQKAQTVSSSQRSPSGAQGQPDPQPAVRAKVPASFQTPLDVPSQAVDRKSEPSSEPVPMIVVQEYDEENKSLQVHTYEQWEHSQFTEMKSQEVVQSQARKEIHTKHYEESQKTLSQPVTQPQPVTQQIDTNNQLMVEAPVAASQPQQKLQRAAPQAQNQQQPAAKPQMKTQQQEKIQIVSTIQKQQVQIQAQTSAQPQPQVQKESAIQHQASHQQQMKARKSQARNRPWLQQKRHLESANQNPAHVLASHIEPEYKGQISFQAPLQTVATSSLGAEIIVQSEANEVKQPQPFTQHQQPRTTSAPLVTSIQPQQPSTIHQVSTQQHQTSISTQAQVRTQKEKTIAPSQEKMKPKTHSVLSKSQTLIQKHTKQQSIAPMQPHGPAMAQWQPQQTVAQTHSVPQLQRFPVSQAVTQSISRSAVQQPPTSVQPQVMMQRQQSPQTGLQTKSLQPLQYPQSAIPPQPKSSSPMQPRINSMPQPQIPVQPEVQLIGQTQLKSQARAPHVVQLQEQPQWGPITQTYPHVQGPISVTSQMHPHFQKYPQSQSVHPTQNVQWPPISPDIVTQTYTTLQAPGQIQIQPQMPSYTKTHPQQWPSPGLEPLPHLYGNIRPQVPVQQMLPPQHWRPVGPVYTIAETQSPQYSQYQALQRPQSPQQQWGSVRAEHQPQVSAHTMFQGVPHTVAQLNHPPVQASTRPRSPQQFQQTQLGPPKTETPSQIHIQSQSAQLQSQVPTNLQLSAQDPSQEQPASRFKQPTLAQAPPQAYTEAYMKAQALVRNRFEEAKHCLQEHIIEGISIFKDKQMTIEQASVKEETLKALDSELLEEFLRAAEGMEAFCTPSELRDMEFFTQSVTTQWEAVQAHISEYLRQLKYEITRQHFIRIVEACEMHVRRQNVNHSPESVSESNNKACFSAEGSLAQAGQQLEALKELCDTLSPEDAHRLAQAQLRECERRLAAIQRQFSGEQDTPPQESRSQMDQTKEPSAQKAQTVPTATEKPKEGATAVSPPQPRTVEKREIVKQTSTEEDRYRSCRFALLAQLNRNEQCMLGDRPSESVTPTDLQKRLRELKCLWDETESLWKEYETVCMQSVQFKDRTVDQDRMELTVRWRDQRSQLQRGVESLGAALELMNSVELKISEISERLDKFIKEPKDIKGYTLANPAILRDVKDLDESIQAEMDRLSRFDSEPSHLDLRDRSPLTQVVLYHRSSLDRLRQQVRKSDAAARALDRFLMSLRTVELDVSSVQSALSSDPAVLQDSRSKLTLIRKGVSSLNDKAPQLDQLLGGAQLQVTQEGRPVSCLDMVGVLVRQVEEVDERLMVRQKDVQKEQHSQGVGLRRKTMLAELRKVQGAAEKQGLKDPTLPAVQHRIRSLSDLESQLNSLRPEYQSIKMSLSSQKEQPDNAVEELNSLWDETEKAVSDRQDQCTVLMELLKKFQSCRSYLGNTLQRAEQTINEQASYMGKDNLQRLLTKVIGIKEDLGGLGSKIEEFRVVCRKLQSQLKKIPNCSETPFEAEADGLVDSWLDVSEKTDSYMDNLRMGLELWEKQLVLGGEVDSWTSTKLIIFSESHPFTSESEVLSMKNEIQTQEDNIEHFHSKSLEIQELLQSKESPLELQVIETNLSKKMEQVKELFSDCTDVFEELLTVKAHLTQKIDTSQSSVENIRSAVEMVHSEDRVQMEAQLQDLCEQLLEQEEQADALLKEITLMFSITGPEAMEDLIIQSKHLKESIDETKNLIRQKKDQGEKSFLQTIKEKFNSFEEWLQDEQLSVNECFENPERREDVEASMQRLMRFLSSKEGEQRLGQLKEMFERSGMEKIPSEAQALLSTWQQEQEGELATLRAHCHGRHKQLDDIIDNLNNLQEEHNHLKECLRQRGDVPMQREKLRHLQEELLQESGRVEAFHDLLSTVRMRGLRGDPLLKDSEALIDQYHSMGIILENQAQVHKALDDQAETFQTHAEQTRAWIRDFKQGVETLEADIPKKMNAQAVLNLSTEGDAKLVHLKEELEALCAHEILEDTRKHELIYSLRNTEDEWKRALDIAQQLKNQAELQDSLSRELQVFKDQEESARSWIEEQLQILHSLGKDFHPQEKLNKLQAVLDLHQEAASRLASLKRQRQIIFSYKELDNERRSHIDQTQSTVEEEWRKVVQLAQELENQVKHEDSLFRELQTFGDQEEDTRSWIRELREILKSLEVPLPIQERMHRIEGILAHRSRGDFKLADLKRKGESLCFCEELEEDKRLTIQQNLQGLQEDWTGVMMNAQELKDRSELEESLSKELQNLQEHEENTQSWIREQQIKIELLGEDTHLQERITGAQAILNSESDGNCKLATLRREAEGLWSRDGVGEKRKQEILQNLKSIEEEWKKVIVGAQERKNKAELQDSLSRVLEIFHKQEESIKNWMKNRKDDLESLGKSTYGTQEQIEERLNKAQEIQTFRSEGNSKIADLKRTADDLNIREDLDEDIKLSLSDKIKRLEAEWKGTLQQAQELHSLLRSVVERLESCHCQREQLQSRLEQVKQQIAALPHHFPWPGYGDRRHTVDQARSLLDRTRALTPSLSALRALGREMSQLTRDSSWIDPSWVTMEECIPELIKELTEFCVNLEMEVRKERVCAQLLEQHTVAQDWLREQVKAFGALPTERRGLQNSINTLKALLQTVEREKKEMKELDAVKNSLMDICTPGGRDTLTLEVSHLHDLCVSSEVAMREQLVVCEARLGDIETRIADRALILRSEAESLLSELRIQDNSLGFLESSQNISQLQENWHNFKICEKEIEAFEGKVRDLGQVLRMAPTNEVPPCDVVSLVDTVTQQYCSLRSKLLEKQNDCADSTVQCVRQALQNIQSWNQKNHANPPSNSATSMQAAIEESAKLRKSLQVALSHEQLLRDCLGPDLAGKLERDGTKTLNETDTHISDLKQALKNLEEKVKQETDRLSMETQIIQQDSQVPSMIKELKFEQSEMVSPSSINTESCVKTGDNEQAIVQPSEDPDSEIPVSEISETTTEIEIYKTRQSLPMLESYTQPVELKTTASEIVPELDTRVCEIPVLTSIREPNKEELSFTSADLETMPENDDVIEKKMQTPSSEAFYLAASFEEIELHDIKIPESQFSTEVLSSSRKLETEKIELGTAVIEDNEDAFIPDSQDQCGEGRKNVAALILDVDIVHIQIGDTDSTTESLIFSRTITDENAMSKQDGDALAPPKTEDSEIALEAKSTDSSLHEPGVVSISGGSSAITSDQSQLSDTDTNKQGQATQAPPTETQGAGDNAKRSIETLTWNNGPTIAQADREGNWTTDDDPRELQRRYIVLDFQEGMEMQRRTATSFREPTEAEIQGFTHPESEREETEVEILSAEDETEVLDNANKHLEAAEMTQPVEEMPDVPARKKKDSVTSESVSFDVKILNVIQEEGTDQTPSEDKEQCIEFEPVASIGFIQQYQSATGLQSDKVNVFSSQEKLESGDNMYIIEDTQAKTTPSGEKAKSIEFESKQMSSVPSQVPEGEPLFQLDKVDISLTLEEKYEGEDIMHVNEEEETTETPSGDEVQCLDAQPKPTPPVRQQNEGRTEVQSENKDVSLTQKEKTEVGDITNIFKEIEAEKTPSGNTHVIAQIIKFEPKHVQAISHGAEGESDIQLDKVSSTPKENPEGGNTMYVIVEEVEKITPSADRPQCIETQPKPTPPVRRRTEDKTNVELDVIPTPPTRRRKGDRLSLNLESQILQGEVLPTPPSRRRREKMGSTISLNLDSEPTPPGRRRKDRENRRFSLDLGAQPTPQARRRKDKEDQRFSLNLGVPPTPPGRRRKDKEDQRLSLDLEAQPTQSERRRKDNEDRRLSLDLEAQSTPPERRRKDKEDRRLSLDLEAQPTPPERRRKDKEDRRLSLDLEAQPTPPERRRKDKEDRRLSLDLEAQPTPPERRHKDKEDQRLSLDLEAQPTQPERRRKDKEDRRLSLDLEAQPTPPERRRKDKEDRRLSLDLEAQPTPPERRRKDKEDQRLSLDLEAQTSPPTRRRKDKEDRRLSLDLEAQPTQPEIRCKDKEDRRLSLDLEAQPTPPERRRKDKEDRRLSLDLEAQPTPPERRRKDKENQRLSLDLEAQTTPPTRRRKDKEESEKPIVKSTPTVRRNVSGVEADITLAVCTPQEEETFVTPTPPKRKKDSKVVKEEMAAGDSLQGENSIVKPTPPLRRKDSQAETEMVLATPPTRRKKDQSENNIVPSMAEDSQVIPTQETRRKMDESETNIVLSMEENLQVIPITPTIGMKYESETDKVPIIPEEPHVIPTPPTRRKNDESETDIIPSMPEKPHFIPTPPTRRKKDDSETDSVSFKAEDPQVIPTSPTRGKKDESETDIVSIIPEEPHVIPSPPTRRKKDESETDIIPSMPEESHDIPTPPTRRKKDDSETDSVSFKPEYPQEIPNPQTRRKKDDSESDIVPIIPEESHDIPTPPTRRKKDDSETDSVSFKPEYPQEIPTPQTRRKKDDAESDIVPIIPEEPHVIPSPPTRRKKEESETDIIPSMPEKSHDKPSPPTRRKKYESETDIIPSMPEESHDIPTPPTRRKKDDSETDSVSFKPEYPQEIPTPQTRRKKDDSESDIVPIIPEEPHIIPTPPTRRKNDETETDIVPFMPEEAHVIPSPPTRRKKNESETDIVPFIPEDPHVIQTPPTTGKEDESETDCVSLKPAEPSVIPTPPTRNEENSEQEKASIFVRIQVEANVEPGTKQEEVDEHDRIDQLLISQEHLEESEDSVTLVQEPIDVMSQTESICEMQLQDKKGEISAQAVLTTENIESSEEEMEEPLGYTIMDIFTEIKQMTEKGAKIVLLEGMPHKSTLSILDTSCADLEARLKRLVFHLLDLRNHPAALNSEDMAKQLEEAEECRKCAQTQVSMLSKQDQANGDIETSTNGTVHDSELMQQLSAQWNAALWDAASAVHSKEAQLQMVADFERQIQRVKASLERLRIEQEALRRSPSESSFVEEERLRSFLRNVEQERSALGELIQTLAKLSPHLSPPERHAAEIQENNLQSQWSVLEIDAERALYKANAYAKEIASLLQEISALKDHLENILKTLDASKSSPVLWDSSKAQEIMRINAELTSSQQQYLNLQQTSEALAQFKAETSSIEKELQNIKEKLDQMGEWIAAQTPASSNQTLSKIVKVMTDALAWAKQTQCDIKGRQKKVSLLPEEVHRQIKTLKKLQLEMSSKQTQLKTLVEEVSELIPELEKADVPMVTLSLKSLEDLSKSTAGQLAEAVREIESGLQTREKMSEQIADVDSWVVGHLRKEALRREDYQSLSVAELDRRLRQIQDTLGEAEKQSALTEALLMKSKDMFSELNVSESSKLNEKLTNLQEDIKNIISYEKACCQKVMDALQSQESSQRKVSSLENSLRQMLIDVKRHRFPVTKDTLSSVEPFKQMVVERKSQVEQVSPCAEDKRRELMCVITELHHQMNELDLKAQEHERYLSLRQCVEDLMQDVVDQILRTKDASIDKEERYRDCQALLTKMSLIKLLCEETKQELHDIKMDLYPTQVSAEETRLKQILENLQSRELALSNNLRILEWDVLKNIHYPSEIKAFQKFLQDTNEELEKPCNIEPKERVIEKELRKSLMLRKDVESRMRVLEFLEKCNVAEPEKRTKSFKQLTCLKDMVLDKCDQRMVNLTKAKEVLRNYTKDLISTIRFLQRTTLVVLPSVCSARSCSERLKDTQQALSTLDIEFQSHISQLQTQAPHHPCFKPQKVECLHTEVLGMLLVRLAMLKAQAQIQLVSLMRCVECQKQSRKCYEDLCQQVRDSETLLSQCTSDNITSHKECKDQGEKLKALVEKVDMLPGQLENLREWCPLHGCRANREDAVSALWGQAARLQRCANDLQKRTEQMEQEWSDVTHSVERAASVLNQVEDELPDSNKQGMSGDELQELLLFWSQYQDRLDCEHRALSALELRAARLLGIPSHLEKAPPIALCQELQALQERYHSLKERSTRGQRAVRAEMEERERVQEQLMGVKEWLDAGVSLLSVLEHEPSKKQLQEVHSQLCTQKAVLQRISEGLKMMYSNRNMLVPEEIEGLLQEVSNSLKEAEEQVETAVEESGPLHRLAAKISEIKAGLGSVVSWLEQKSLNFSEAESTQKRVWDELEGLHTRLTAVEVELQDMSVMYPDETRLISENLANAQQTYSKLTKQAEQRTSFLSKVHDWLKEHEEMVKASQSWISEAQSWLTTACTYTTARCLDSHVNALQMVLDDSAQMRRTLQHFGSVLTEMGSVFDVSPLREQLSDADRRVADMQHSLLGPLSQLEHAAAEVDAIEAEMKVMEKDVAKIKSSLNVQEGISRDKLKANENRIELMKKTVAEIQNCKEGLCLPDKAENTLLVFKRAELLQKQLEEIEQLALEYSIEVQEIFAPLPDTIASLHSSTTPHFVPPTIAEEETQDTGEIQIVHVEEDVLKKSGATLMTVEQSTPEQRLTWNYPREAQESEEAENLSEDAENTEEEDNDEDDESSEESEYHTDNEQEEAERMSASLMNPETSSSVITEETSPLVDPTEQKPEQTEATALEVAVDTEADTSAAGTGLSEASSEATEADTSAASGTGVSEASSEATEESESLPTDMVTNTSSVTEITSSSPPRGLQRCLVS